VKLVAIEGKIAKILGRGEVVINRGRIDSVRHGMVFEVFAAEGDEVWDPDTGETLGTVEDIKAHAEVTEVKDRLAIARLRQEQSSSPFGAAGVGDMQDNLQRMFQQMFGEGVQVQGFGVPTSDDEEEEIFGSPLEDVTKVQVGDAAREIRNPS
jgi:hypothetical protein